MTKKKHMRPADISGMSQMAVDATLGVTDLVEAMHAAITHVPGMVSTTVPTRTTGIPGLVYHSIRGITRMVGNGIDTVLTPLILLHGERPSSPERDALLAVLNGVVGDHLAATGSPLSLSMQLRQNGHPLTLASSALTAAVSQPRSNILLLIHGLGMTDRHWCRNEHDHGARLAADRGYTPVYLYYNTGLHISVNGRTCAAMLERLLQHWPVPVHKLAIIGHSMGGLVARSACYYGACANHTWLRHLSSLVFLGTPHHGAPLERWGNIIQHLLGRTPYSAPFMRLGQIRSAGITDLRYGNVRTEDWSDGDRFAHTGDRRHLVALPDSVPCYTIAASTGQTAGDVRDHLLGDGIVPLHSALGIHRDPARTVPFPVSHQWTGYTMNHLDLLNRFDVYEQIRHWLVA